MSGVFAIKARFCRAILYKMFCAVEFVGLLLLFSAASAIDQQQVYHAVRGEGLDLRCPLDACLTTKVIWTNVTTNNSETIESGIDSQSGELSVPDYVGGQKYRCSCGAAAMTYIIHVDPVMNISISSADVPVGGEVCITCTVSGGYSDNRTLDLIHPGGRTEVENGRPHCLKAERSGELECSLTGTLRQQHSAPIHLTVFNKPEVVKVTNATTRSPEGGDTVTLTCTVSRKNCTTVALFYTGDKQVDVSNDERLSLYHRVIGDLLKSYLIIDEVAPEDIAKYECRVFANYTKLQLITSRDLFVLPAVDATPTTHHPSTHPPCNEGASPEVTSYSTTLKWSIPLSVFLILTTIILAALGVLHCVKKRFQKQRKTNQNVNEV